MPMTDIAIDTIVDRYIALWNEPEPARRRALIAEAWSEGAAYVDPMQEGRGRDGIDTMVAAVQERFPGYRFRRSGTAEAHNGHARFGWMLLGPDGQPAGIAGTDFATLAEDGRLRTVVGFLDQLPAQPPAT